MKQQYTISYEKQQTTTQNVEEQANDKEKEQNGTVGTKGGEYDKDIQLGEINGGESNNEEQQDEMKM